MLITFKSANGLVPQAFKQHKYGFDWFSSPFPISNSKVMGPCMGHLLLDFTFRARTQTGQLTPLCWLWLLSFVLVAPLAKKFRMQSGCTFTVCDVKTGMNSHFLLRKKLKHKKGRNTPSFVWEHFHLTVKLKVELPIYLANYKCPAPFYSIINHSYLKALCTR